MNQYLIKISIRSSMKQLLWLLKMRPKIKGRKERRRKNNNNIRKHIQSSRQSTKISH